MVKWLLEVPDYILAVVWQSQLESITFTLVAAAKVLCVVVTCHGSRAHV